MTSKWTLSIGENAPGARGSHSFPVVDINNDGCDEVLWASDASPFMMVRNYSASKKTHGTVIPICVSRCLIMTATVGLSISTANRMSRLGRESECTTPADSPSGPCRLGQYSPKAGLDASERKAGFWPMECALQDNPRMLSAVIIPELQNLSTMP